MKLLIIGPNSSDNKRLVKAALKRGHTVKRVAVTSLVFILKNNQFKILHNKRNIAHYDVCLIRGINPYFDKAKTVAKYMKRQGKKVIDRELYRKVYAFDKIFMYSALNYHGLPCINTYYFPDLTEYKKSGMKFSYPVMVKDIQGMRGRNIFIKDNKKQLFEFLQQHEIERFFVQRLVDVEYYYRVLVVGDKVLGAMRRYTLKYIRENKIPLSDRSFLDKITAEQKELALKSARATNTDIAGVDLIYSKTNKPYILEVNRAPRFGLFTKVMQVNVADEIIKYLERIK